MPDLHGETWLITGSTSGLGLATARFASSRGARIVLAVRNVDRGRAIAEELGDASVLPLELDDLASVRAAAAGAPQVDVLVNNAGVVAPTRRETADGFEWDLGVNALGPFCFTNLMLERVRRRIVIVGSLAHRSGRLDLEDPNFRRRRWHMNAAYAQSKLADLLWAGELSRRLAASGSAVDVQLAHPGWADTALANQAPGRVGAAVVGRAARLLANTAEQGALCVLIAATQALPSASYVGPSGPGQLRGRPTLVSRSTAAADPALQRRFWAYAEAATAAPKGASAQPSKRLPD